jgi:chemotaxis protein methyltransferase CheR
MGDWSSLGASAGGGGGGGGVGAGPGGGSLAATWGSVQTFMHERCGVVLANDQSYLLEARLGPVASELKFPSVHDYVRAVCGGGSGGVASTLVERMIDAMTTHETYFFRDSGFWKALEEHILPRLIHGRSPGRPLRIWSAACSTGQEIYSLAMLLDELWPDAAASAEYYATDISTLSIAHGQAGRYSVLEVNRGVSAMRLMRHFEQDGGSFRVRERLRQRVRWSTFNLLGHDAAPPACDLMLCRNVLIYFEDRNRQRALRRLATGISHQGVVGVGAAELLPGPSLFPGLYPATVLHEPSPETMRATQ